MKIDLSNKTKEERMRLFEDYIYKRSLHRSQPFFITVANLRKKFKLSHLKDGKRIDAFFERIMVKEVHPLIHKVLERNKNLNNNRPKRGNVRRNYTNKINGTNSKYKIVDDVLKEEGINSNYNNENERKDIQNDGQK
ncbi:MAG: hypothetical protein QXG00_04135 [Candidatus Woesearchaeota archaeon]